MSSSPRDTSIPIIFAPPTYQYDKFKLDEKDICQDPIEQFHKWYDEALKNTNETLPESVTFTTAELPSGKVSSRILLFKELDHRGFVIYSNWETSRKSKDIKTNPQAALNFFWKDSQRQVRVEGETEFVNRDTTERYFQTRTRGSRLGSWVSKQTTVLANRQELEDSMKQIEKKYDGDKARDIQDIPCPEYWGGLRVVPLLIEFWQGREHRLHDRFVYTRQNEDDDWKVMRLSP